MLANEPANINGQRPVNGEHKPISTAGEGKGSLRRSHSRPAAQGLAAACHELAIAGIAPSAIHAMMRPAGRASERDTMTFGLAPGPGAIAQHWPPNCGLLLVTLSALAGAAPASGEDADVAYHRSIERRTFSDAEIIDGFFKVTFGAEFHVAGGVDRIRKYEGPVLVYVDNRAEPTAARKWPRSSPTSVRTSAISISP